MERPKGKLLPLFGDHTKVDLFHAWCEANFEHHFTFDARPFGSYEWSHARGDGFDVLVDGHPDDLRLLEWEEAE